ncbi:hypothetical protein [Nitrococcus mobilis]|uniref:hypothetical protein n=1 Tax=Nitrococcus mobilis TaxID=35797 RepID=UPI000325D33C|nr:hypothetical protein [Nitrococcus mobilis]
MKNNVWPYIKKKASSFGGSAHAFVEFCGRHPFATGLFALLSVAGLILSIVGYYLDRQEATSTTGQVLRIEEKIDTISETNNAPNTNLEPVYRECDDHQVYLAVMESARNLSEPYSNWEVRGSTGVVKTLSPGVCEMTVLFVTGDPAGKMAEVDIVYKTDVPVSSIRIQTTKERLNYSS